MGEVMGRDLKVGSARLPEPHPNQSADLLNQAFEAALRGDPEALEVLLTILKTRYGKGIFKALRHHRGYAHTATIDDIFQESIVDFIQEIQSGALAELEASERRNVVQYFQRICDRKLANLKKARKDPVFDPKKTAIPFDVVEDKRNPGQQSIPGDERKTEKHLGLVHKEIAKLASFDRLVLERYLAGIPYIEISKETRTNVSTLESLVTRIKRKLADRIARESQTAKLNLERKNEPVQERSCLPTREEILAEIEELPIETQDAITFVHVNGGSIEALAKSLGDRGLEKAEARLKRGYESLNLKLDLPFPESFEVFQK
jgi:DNA-directed RNA polymerase specialized sigma24 family protein